MHGINIYMSQKIYIHKFWILMWSHVYFYPYNYQKLHVQLNTH